MFKEYFKKYKDKGDSLVGVLDFNKDVAEVNKVELPGHTDLHFFGMKSPSSWEVYELKQNPGLIFLKNPFTCRGQRYWIARSLKCYSRKPNRTNIDIHGLLADDGDWWNICRKNNDSVLRKKLRWVTLGYHHDWDTKVYHEESRDQFPDDLQCLSQYIANLLGYENFKAEAAIVNFYHMNSTLSGHTDHSEQNLEAPLLSFSFGQTAIFLLGGKTLEEKPTALFLHSGDIVVMTKESRLSYHGVPRILKSSSEPWNILDDEDTEGNNLFDVFKCDKVLYNMCSEQSFWKDFNEYIQSSRININVRQVLYSEQNTLTKGN